METFAFRRPDLNHHFQVFEIDRPTAQALKRQRLAGVGLAPPAHLHFVPVDFAHENVDTALTRSRYDPQRSILDGESQWCGKRSRYRFELKCTPLPDGQPMESSHSVRFMMKLSSHE